MTDTSPKLNSAAPQRAKVRLAEIVVPARKRQLDEQKVQELAESIRDIGLLQPIGITEDKRLVFGWHRLEACKRLGWEEIEVTIVDPHDELRRELAEIDENLVRCELSVLERGEHLARRKEIYEKLYPHTKHGGAPGKPGGGKEQKAKDAPGASFAKDTAAKTGLSPRTIQEDVQIARNIVPEVRDEIRNTPLANARRELRRLARLSPQQQREAAQKILKNLEKRPHVAYNSGDNEWYTPPEYIEAARRTMGDIDVDPASSEAANRIVQAKVFYTAEQDGLQQEWRGRVWLNPPYAQPLVNKFCAALVAKVRSGEVSQACVLTNNATETSWFQELLTVASALCLIKGRVKFLDPDGLPTGAPLQGQIVSYIGPHVEKFAKEFRKFGPILYAERRDTQPEGSL
jgi:ParB family chromosome partitioning protein